MPYNLPTPPHLLERAAHGNKEAMSDLVRARMERVYQLAATLLAGQLGTEPPAALRAEESGEYPVAPPSGSPLRPESLWRSWHLASDLQRAICALPDAERQVLVLEDVEGLASDQVAWLLNLSEAEIEQRRSRARLKLRELLLARRSHAQSA